MVEITTWHDIEDALVYKASDEFAFWSAGIPEERLEWTQYDSRGRPFLITVRNDLGKVILAWGWEHSTLHDAVEWTTRKPQGPAVPQRGTLKEVFATSERLVELVTQEVRRVAEFGDYDLKRQLEFAELKAAFDEVVDHWDEHLERAGNPLFSIPEVPDPIPPVLELSGPAECVLVHGEKTVRLSKDETGWRINVQEAYTIGPEIWRFTEEMIVQKQGTDIVHSSDLTEEILRTVFFGM